MTKVKICGVRTPENALMVARAGADLIGLNFYSKTLRYVELGTAREIVRELREELGEACPKLVGVFVNAPAEEVSAIVGQVDLDFAQLSGDEAAETLLALQGIGFKAIRPVAEAEALAAAEGLSDSFPQIDGAPSLLLDAFNPKLYGGTGETASESVALAIKAVVPRLMLAGGLNPRNVAERVRRINPWGVDVASGVEAGMPGIKDEGKVRDFIAAVRSVAT